MCGIIQSRIGDSRSTLPAQALPGLAPINARDGLVAPARQRLLEEPARDGLVFCDQDTHGHPNERGMVCMNACAGSTQSRAPGQ